MQLVCLDILVWVNTCIWLADEKFPIGGLAAQLFDTYKLGCPLLAHKLNWSYMLAKMVFLRHAFCSELYIDQLVVMMMLPISTVHVAKLVSGTSLVWNFH